MVVKKRFFFGCGLLNPEEVAGGGDFCPPPSQLSSRYIYPDFLLCLKWIRKLFEKISGRKTLIPEDWTKLPNLLLFVQIQTLNLENLFFGLKKA